MNREAHSLAEYCCLWCYGQENALPKAEIARRLGLSERLIFDLAQECREEGFPIISTCTAGTRGMFYAARAEEIDRADAELGSRMSALHRHRQALKRLRAKIFEGMPLFAGTFPHEISRG